jgi:hypothetical protein
VPAAHHLRGQAARGRTHALRLQDPEGVDAAPRAAPPRLLTTRCWEHGTRRRARGKVMLGVRAARKVEKPRMDTLSPRTVSHRAQKSSSRPTYPAKCGAAAHTKHTRTRAGTPRCPAPTFRHANKYPRMHVPLKHAPLQEGSLQAVAAHNTSTLAASLQYIPPAAAAAAAAPDAIGSSMLDVEYVTSTAK